MIVATIQYVDRRPGMTLCGIQQRSRAIAYSMRLRRGATSPWLHVHKFCILGSIPWISYRSAADGNRPSSHSLYKVSSRQQEPGPLPPHPCGIGIALRLKRRGDRASNWLSARSCIFALPTLPSFNWAQRSNNPLKKKKTKINVGVEI